MTDGTAPATNGVLVRYLSSNCRCGTDGNFCSRGRCRNCEATAPARIRKLARKKQVKQNNCKSHAKGNALAKAQRLIADLQKKLHAGGNTEEESDKSKVSKWTKGLPKLMRPEALSTGVSTSPPALEESVSTPDYGVFRRCDDALRAMSNAAHQQMAAALTALADEHRDAKQKEMPLARRVQHREKEASVRWIRWKLRIEICPNSSSIFKRCIRTQAKRCKMPKRNWSSFKQNVPKWLRGVRPQRSRMISRSCCAGPCPSPMRPSVNRWRRWSERPKLFVPDPQGPARQSRCTKICRRHRRKTDVGEGCARAANVAGVVGRVGCKTQRRSFSIITANVTL